MIAGVVESLSAEGRTVVAITHDMDFCAEHFDRVVVMAEGLVLADGDAREVFDHAAVSDRAALEPPQLLRLAARLRLARPSAHPGRVRARPGPAGRA